jgi:translation initiation factor IF-3
LNKVAEQSSEFGKIEAHPRQDGRNMTMVLAPDKKVPAKKSDDATDATDEPTAE